MIILVLLLGSGCTRQEPERSIDLNQLFFSITESEYSANWSFSGEDGLAYLYSGDRENILDYLIVKSEDPLAPNMFIFLKIKETNKESISESINRYLQSMDTDDEWGMDVSELVVHTENDYQFYILSNRADEYKERILNNLK